LRSQEAKNHATVIFHPFAGTPTGEIDLNFSVPGDHPSQIL